MKFSQLRWLMDLLLIIVAGLLLAGLTIRVLENRLIYFPSRWPEGFDPVASSGLNVEEVTLKTADGVRISGWFLPASSRPAVLLWFHGNAGNVADRLEQMKVLAALGTSLLAVDYRGYGKSEGSPSEVGLYQDADCAYQFLIETKRFRPGQILIYGQSLGGAVAVELASRRPCGGLILESTFTRGREMARRMLRLPLLEYFPRTRFDSLGKIGQVQAPVLIIHGTRDTVIPWEMGRRLYEAAAGPKWFFAVEGAGHDNPFQVAEEAYLARLRTFVRTATSQEGRANEIH